MKTAKKRREIINGNWFYIDYDPHLEYIARAAGVTSEGFPTKEQALIWVVSKLDQLLINYYKQFGDLP